MNKLFIIAGVSVALAACGSKNAETPAEHDHEAETHSTECTHGHSHEHGLEIVGVAKDGDATAGKITIIMLDDTTSTTYDYSASNQDKIAAWMPGDTVTIFIDRHQHGDHAHDSITAIKLGNHACAHHDHDHEGHNHDANCDHQH